MPKIAENLTRVRQEIAAQAQSAGRDPGSITLLAVSKTKPPEALCQAYDAGQRDFGENYLQEALEKIAALKRLPIQWHFIGALQSNKTRAVAEHFHWVHTVDRVKLGERLSAQRPAGLPPLNLCLQVNIDREDSKAGCEPEQAQALARALAALPNLRLRGLMAIPAARGGTGAFARLARLMQSINDQEGLDMDTLSMGMSDDLAEAIGAGATIVRVGTAIFGARSANV